MFLEFEAQKCVLYGCHGIQNALVISLLLLSAV